MKLYGQDMTKEKLGRLVGDIHQIAGAQRFAYTEGRAKGLDAIEIRNGNGLRIVVLPDRGMDIAYAEYKGVPFSYISNTGLASSAYFEESDFLRNFAAGLLTTCGLTYMGAACVDEGRQLGIHGRIANTPAYNVSIDERWTEDGRFKITVSGCVRESRALGDNVLLKREITVYLGEDRVYLNDTVINEGYNETPLMVLYHMNFGYPLVTKDTVLETNCTDLWTENEFSLSEIDKAAQFCDPIPHRDEQLYFRKAPHTATAKLKNPVTGLAVGMTFCGDELAYLTEWKFMGEQSYVVGVEPGTYLPVGRAKARERGELDFIAPQEQRHFGIVLEIENV